MKRKIDLNIDMSSIKNHQDYRAVWDDLCPIEIKMVEQYEECKHKIGDTFIYENPYTKPAGLCGALMHVAELYLWRAELGFPSWNEDNRRVFRVHCPDAKGTVWEIRKVEKK
ncbi:MAG: hypothetical protein CVV21_02210 [Candidatus Goldiibacteriota bacterium HGW-Goldbacteria-1]|jgi:uncharacterized repeat protein (TIGR04076 family)|nr:MAG: hypothetical protein CVV21_02210 [Candidatus Goldiibacteriota bacterium HGW-Goldbacteria-1]